MIVFIGRLFSAFISQIVLSKTLFYKSLKARTSVFEVGANLLSSGSTVLPLVGCSAGDSSEIIFYLKRVFIEFGRYK